MLYISRYEGVGKKCCYVWSAVCICIKGLYKGVILGLGVYL